MAYKRKRFLPVMLLITGSIFCLFSFVLVNYFLRAARPIIMMGSGFESGSPIFESIIFGFFILLLCGIGITLIILSVRNIGKSFKRDKSKRAA